MIFYQAAGGVGKRAKEGVAGRGCPGVLEDTQVPNVDRDRIGVRIAELGLRGASNAQATSTQGQLGGRFVFFQVFCHGETNV